MTKGWSQRWPWRTTWVVALLCIALAMLAHGNSLPYFFKWNTTPSLPEGLYWSRPASFPLSYGEEVCVPYHPPSWAAPRDYWVPGKALCKQVYGLPGDKIEKRQDHLFICRTAGCVDAGKIQSRDSVGRPVYAATFPPVIPKGKVYLGATYVWNSLDSRYLGLQNQSSVVRTIRPLWVKKSTR